MSFRKYPVKISEISVQVCDSALDCTYNNSAQVVPLNSRLLQSQSSYLEYNTSKNIYGINYAIVTAITEQITSESFLEQIIIDLNNLFSSQITTNDSFDHLISIILILIEEPQLEDFAFKRLKNYKDIIFSQLLIINSINEETIEKIKILVERIAEIDSSENSLFDCLKLLSEVIKRVNSDDKTYFVETSNFTMIRIFDHAEKIRSMKFGNIQVHYDGNKKDCVKLGISAYNDLERFILIQVSILATPCLYEINYGLEVTQDIYYVDQDFYISVDTGYDDKARFQCFYYDSNWLEQSCETINGKMKFCCWPRGKII